VPIVLKSGSLNFLEPSGPVQACTGIALPLTFTFMCGGQIAEVYVGIHTKVATTVKKFINSVEATPTTSEAADFT